MPREPVEIQKRGKLTKFEFACLFLEQKGRCGCGCGERLEAGKVDEEHTTPVAMGGDSKPDSLWRRECHKAKTKKDVASIAKAERQGGRTGQYAKRKRNGPQLKSRNDLGGDAYKARKEWAERNRRDQ